MQLRIAQTIPDTEAEGPGKRFALWVQGCSLPTAPGSGRERVLCEWDSQLPGYGFQLRSIVRDGFLCTVYEESTDGRPSHSPCRTV